MRRFALFAAIPLALGCAQQTALRVPSPPSDEPLRVRLYQPGNGALNYHLSEPAHVAIFAITRGHGVSMIYPYFQSQVDHRGRAGLNQETVHGGAGAWGYSAGSRYEHRALFGHADAYFIVASRFPLPVEGFLQSPFLLRSLMGADRFRATQLSDAWDALETILVEGLPEGAWATDVYLNWRDPFVTLAWEPRRFMQYCRDGRGFLAYSILDTGPCGALPRAASGTPPIPVAEGPARSPPKRPLDREPFVPMPPEALARESRAATDMIREERARREEPARAPALPVESRPERPPAEPRLPAEPEGTRPTPIPDS